MHNACHVRLILLFTISHVVHWHFGLGILHGGVQVLVPAVGFVPHHDHSIRLASTSNKIASRRDLFELANIWPESTGQIMHCFNLFHVDWLLFECLSRGRIELINGAHKALAPKRVSHEAEHGIDVLVCVSRKHHAQLNLHMNGAHMNGERRDEPKLCNHHDAPHLIRHIVTTLKTHLRHIALRHKPSSQCKSGIAFVVTRVVKLNVQLGSKRLC